MKGNQDFQVAKNMKLAHGIEKNRKTSGLPEVSDALAPSVEGLLLIPHTSQMKKANQQLVWMNL